MAYGGGAKTYEAQLGQMLRMPSAVAWLGAVSLVWFAAEVMFYEAQSTAPNPASATAIWNIAPLPVFLLSLAYYGTRPAAKQIAGVITILIAVYLINM